MDDKSALTLPPAPGDVWRINMFRMDVPQGKPQQAAGWSPPMVGDFHALDKFGELVFGDAKGVVPPPRRAVAPALAKEKSGGARRRSARPAQRRRRPPPRPRPPRRARRSNARGPLAPRGGERAGTLRSPRPAQRGEGRGEGPVAVAVCLRGGVRRDAGAAARQRRAHVSADVASAATTRHGRAGRLRAGRAGGEELRADARRPIGRAAAAGRSAAAGVAGEVRAAARKQRRAGRPSRIARLDWAMTDLARQRARRRSAGAGRGRVPAGALRPGRAVAAHPAVAAHHRRGAASSARNARAEIAEMLRTADIGRVGIGVDRLGRHDLRRDRRCRRQHVELLGAIPRRCRAAGHAPIAARIAARPREPRRRDHGARRHGARADAAAARRRRPRRAPLRRGRALPGRDRGGRRRPAATVLANFPVYCGVDAARRGAARRGRPRAPRSPPRRPSGRCWRWSTAIARAGVAAAGRATPS